MTIFIWTQQRQPCADRVEGDKDPEEYLQRQVWKLSVTCEVEGQWRTNHRNRASLNMWPQGVSLYHQRMQYCACTLVCDVHLLPNWFDWIKVFMSYSTQNRSFQRHASQATSWLGTEEAITGLNYVIMFVASELPSWPYAKLMFDQIDFGCGQLWGQFSWKWFCGGRCGESESDWKQHCRMAQLWVERLPHAGL